MESGCATWFDMNFCVAFFGLSSPRGVVNNRIEKPSMFNDGREWPNVLSLPHIINKLNHISLSMWIRCASFMNIFKSMPGYINFH